MKESQKGKESGGARASKKKTYKQKQVKNMILKKLKRKMQQGLHKLEEQHEHLGKLLANLNNLKIEESNALALHKMTKELARQIKRVNEENNDDIAILKMERDLIKADFTKSKNSLKVYEDELLQGEEEEGEGAAEGAAEEGEEEEEEEEHHQQHHHQLQQHKQQGQNDYEEGGAEQEEVSRSTRHDKRKKKKRKSSNANSSQQFTNSFIPLQVFRDNCLCMNNKCHHNEFASDHVQVKKNWVFVDLYRALLRNKYYKGTHLCGKIFGEHDSSEIYRREVRRMRKMKLLLNFLSCRGKRRKSGREQWQQGLQLGWHMEESDLGAHSTGGSYPCEWDGQEGERDQTGGPLGKGPLSNGTPTSCDHRRKALPDSFPPCSSSNPIDDQRNRNVSWITMKNEINEEVSKKNSSIMTGNMLTFLVSISKVFSCELIQEKREKPLTNDFPVNKKCNKFYDYLPAQQHNLMSMHHAAGTGHRSSASAMNTNEMRGAHQSCEVRENHICLYLKREHVPPYLLNLGKKIKLILNFASADGLRGCASPQEGGEATGEPPSGERPTHEPLTGQTLTGQPLTGDGPCGEASPPAAERGARLEHEGGPMQRYRSLFLKKKKQKRKKSGKEKKLEGTAGNGSGGGSGACAVRAFDDNHRFNNTFLSALLRRNLSEKKRYHYFYVNSVEYDHMGYDVEDIIFHLEKVVSKWERNSNSCGGGTFSPLTLLNYVSKKYALYSSKGKKKKKKNKIKCKNKSKGRGKGKGKAYHVKGERHAEGVHQGQGAIEEECLKFGKAAGVMKGAAQVRKGKAKGKAKVKGECEKQYQEEPSPLDEEFIPNGLKGAATSMGEDVEAYYLTIHKDMLSYSSINDEVTVKYYVTHMHNREFNLEEGSQEMAKIVHPTFSYYLERKKQLEKMMKEHSVLYKEIFKMWKEDIEIGEKERERKNIFAWGILPVRAYDHPNIFVPLPYGFKHNNKNLAYSSLRSKRPFADEEEDDYDGEDDDGCGADENGNVMEKRGKEKKKDYMNIKYANLTGPCITWRKNCIALNYSKKRRNPHLVEAVPYLYCMQGPKMPLFSLERNVRYCNENNRCVAAGGSLPCGEARSSPLACKGQQGHPVCRSNQQGHPVCFSNQQNEKNFIWERQEIKTFLEKYFLYPKNFEKISQYLEFKSTKQCVDFYYLTKNFFNFKKFLLTLSLSRVKRNKRHRSAGNDATKRNSKEEIVAQLMEKLESNCAPNEFEQANFFHLNFINLRHFFQGYFAKTFGEVQGGTGAGEAAEVGAAAGGAAVGVAAATTAATAATATASAAEAETQRSKTIVLENMSDGYVVPKNYKFILSANKKLCFLVKNEENLIYSGVNSDIIEIVYNDHADGDRKKRKSERGERVERVDPGEKKKKKAGSIERIDSLDRAPFPAQNAAHLTLDKVALADNQQPSTATCSRMITTPPPSNSNEASERGFPNRGNDPPPKGFDVEKAFHRHTVHANAVAKQKKAKRDNQEMDGQLLNCNREEKAHPPRESDEMQMQNGEATRGAANERDKVPIAYCPILKYNRDDYNPFGGSGQVVNLRRGSGNRGEEEEEDDDDEVAEGAKKKKKNTCDEEAASLVRPGEVKTHDVHYVDSRSSSVLGMNPQASNDDDVLRRVSFPDSNDSMNNPFEYNVKIETSEESLYKCFEFLKNINWRDTRNVEAAGSKNGVQQEPLPIGRYSAAPVTLEGKMKKVSRKNSIQSNEGVSLQKERNVKRKDSTSAGKSKGGGGKDNTTVGGAAQWEEGSTGHSIHASNRDERNHSGKRGKAAVSHTWASAPTKRRLSNGSSWNGAAVGAVGAVGAVASVASVAAVGINGARAADPKRDSPIKRKCEKAPKRKKTADAQMREEGPGAQAVWDNWAISGDEELLSVDMNNSMGESQLRAEAVMQICGLNMSEGLMCQASASQEHQPYDSLINSQSLYTQNSWVQDSNESGGLLVGRSYLPGMEDMKQDRLDSDDHLNFMGYNNRSSVISLQGEDHWEDLKWNGGSCSVEFCKKGKAEEYTGEAADAGEAAEVAGNHPVESLFTQLPVRENPSERSDVEHRRNSMQSSKSSNQCSVESLQHMESYEGGFYDDPSKQPFRKTATKWTDREKEIYYEVFEKEGKNWDTLLLALHPYGKTREQIKNFYQNTIVKRRKSEAP
ncbi:unnamed protein product [Plasmodium vivax]|uniref:(malaria parasite P. vivax) hypothetical protein n=1 Tax=Plasmodium vivax TaxID=5855 RepID=A0A8S4H877_PLAVI|nr:unnamed protein product [Plasmodium vivax]